MPGSETNAQQSIALFRRRVVASMLLPSGVFCLALLISLILLGYLWDANEAVRQSDLVLAQANAAFRRVATSQSTVRGYMLFERPRFLESYRNAKVNLWTELEELLKLTSDNVEQQARLLQLKVQLTRYLDLSDQALATHQQRKPVVWTDQQEALAVQIRDTFDGFLLLENQMRLQRLERSQRLVRRVVLGTALGSLVLGIGIAFYLRNLITGLLRNYWRVLKTAEEVAMVRERDYFFTLRSHLMCISGSDGYFKQLSLGWERTLGYSQEELLARPFVEFVHPDDRTRTNQVKEEADDADQSGFVNRYRHKDGHYVWLRWSSSPRPDSDLVYASAVDVSEQHWAQQEILRLNSQLQEKVLELDRLNRELESFAYSVSHDLRSPLRALDGFAQALLRHKQDQLDAQGQQFLGRIKLAAQKMGELIDDLLLLSRVTQAETNLVEVDLSAMAEEILRELRLENPERQVSSLVEPGLRLLGDRSLIRIMLSNLLGNAWKYTGRRPQAEISLTRQQTARGSAWCIRDDGAGFDMEYSDKLFVPFQRLHRPGDFEGTGVGLATVERVVRRHGGTIWAESEVGKGAAFYFQWNEEN